MEIYNHTVTKNYYDFTDNNYPFATISATLSTFVKNGDTRVKRIKQSGGTYSYYLTKNEQNLNIDGLNQSEIIEPKKIDKAKTYDERDLHKLLSSYLKNLGTYSKTIFHEHSTFGKDNNQIWTHPDMIGIRFINLQTQASQNLQKSISRLDTFKISSYLFFWQNFG